MHEALAWGFVLVAAGLAPAELRATQPRNSSFQALSRQTLRQTPDMRDWSSLRRSAYRRSLKQSLPRPVAVLELPRFGLRVAVLPRMDDVALNRAVAHVSGTAAPGQHGNVGIAGHRDSWFRPLENIHRGDELRLVLPGGVRDYVVAESWVTVPKDVRSLARTKRDALTLVTCFPFRYYGEAPKRFIVRAYPR